MESLTRTELERLTEVLSAGTGTVRTLPPQLRYAIAGVTAYLAAAEEGAPGADRLRANAVALWDVLHAAAEAAATPDPLPAS